MQEDTIHVFCLSHGVSFTMPRSNQAVVCREDPANHVLSDNFPNSGRWFYCCQCQTYWVASKRRGGFPKQCPACGLIKKARYYSCDQCNVTMMSSLGATNQNDVYIMPWGMPHPYCPGCYQLPKSIPQSHRCLELNGLITTARAECPFCEVEERAESQNGMVDKEGAGYETEIARVESEDELVVADASDLFLEELERKAAEVRALEAEAEAREAKAQERLRQAEVRLQQELSLRSEAEQKSKEIEEELRQKLENDWNRLEAVVETSETTAQIEAERKARLAAEQAKAEAEARLREMEARACEAEERCRQAEAGLQQEAAKQILAEERANEIEVEFNRSMELAWVEFETAIANVKAEAQSSEESIVRRITEQSRAEVEAVTKDAHARIQAEVKVRREAEQVKAKAQKAEAKAKQTVERDKVEIAEIKAEVEARVQEVEARARRAEEIYKIEIAEISAELKATAIAANQAEESYRAELAKVSAEAEAQAHQAEAKARRQYQTKVEEAIASAQATMLTLEEAQKKSIEAEAKYWEMEARAHRAETRSRQIYLISRLSFAFVEQIFGGTLNMSDEKGGLVIPPDFATNAYLDKLCSEMGESNTNDSMEYGDFSSPDKLKALFEVLARAQVFGNEGNTNDNGMSLVPVECVMNEDVIPTSVIPAPTKPVIS